MFSEPDRERGEGGGDVLAGSASLLSGAPRGAEQHIYNHRHARHSTVCIERTDTNVQGTDKLILDDMRYHHICIDLLLVKL